MMVSREGYSKKGLAIDRIETYNLFSNPFITEEAARFADEQGRTL